MKTIVEMQFGSHVYGTNLPISDTDFKAVAIPEAKDIILQRAFRSINESTGDQFSRNTSVDVDKETFSLHYFMKLLTEGQTVCLDMLFTPSSFYRNNSVILNDSAWYQIKANQDKLVTKKMSAFAGYCQAQAAKYSLKGSNLNAYETAMNFFAATKSPSWKVGDVNIPLLLESLSGEKIKGLNGKETPLAQIVMIKNNKGVEETYLQVGPKTKVPFNAKVSLAYEIFKAQYDKYGERAKLAQSNEGVDWKALMHAVRVCYEAIELCKTGNITFPRPEAPLLLQIRKGELPYQQVAEMIEQGLLDLTEAKEKSSLPEAPDYKWIEDFTCEVYSEQIKRNA